MGVGALYPIAQISAEGQINGVLIRQPTCAIVVVGMHQSAIGVSLNRAIVVSYCDVRRLIERRYIA
jgi:hypothetical protein